MTTRTRRKTAPITEPAPPGADHQPVAAVQWIPREELRANDYNPNRVAPPELALLRRSILEDGWTQPIVIRGDREIVDGFHRWTVSSDPDVYALTDGLVPVVTLRDDLSPEHQRMSTIRHNRARGAHTVTKMADIVSELLEESGLADEELVNRLGMEIEEVRRLRDRGDMLKRGRAEEFGKAWVPE
jgi:ParB-like chromosome segregation protein Spo0J